MTTVQFEFGSPRASGVDVPAGIAVECALLQAEGSGGAFRSTTPFTVPLDAGVGSAVLSATGPDQCWHVRVIGVDGVAERWVDVPASSVPVRFVDLVDADPASVPIGPDVRPRWEELRDGMVPRDAFLSKGDILVGSVADGPVRVPAGVAGQVLTVRPSAPAGVEWATPSGGGGGDTGGRDIGYPGPQVIRLGGMPLRWPWPVRITSVALSLGAAPVGADLIVDVNVAGSTVFAAGDRPRVAAGALSSSKTVAVDVAAQQPVTVDVDQVGSTIAGTDLVVTLLAVRT